MLEQKNNNLKYILSIIFIVVAFYPLFAFLGSMPLRLWDESRLAASAYEMTQTSNPLIVTFFESPDLWSVKPPLLIWIQAIFIKLFGVNEVAVRLPSAISILVIGVSSIMILSKLRLEWVGLLAGLIIISSNGIMGYHCARNADYDAMLIMFMVVYVLFFFVYTETKESKYLYYFTISLILATLTKGVQALIPLPILFFYILLSGQLIEILKNKNLYINLSLFILLIGGYYLGREVSSSGYLRAVYENELGGRYLSALEEHSREPLFYLKELRHGVYSYFFYPSIIAFLFNLISRNNSLRRLNILSFSIAGFILLIISIGKTKLPWYVLPVVPFLSISLGIGLYRIGRWLRIQIENNKIAYPILSLLLILILFTPYKNVIKMNTNRSETDIEYYSRFNIIKKVVDKELVFDKSFTFLYNDNNQDHVFYKYKMWDRGIEAQTHWYHHIKVGDILLINSQEAEDEVGKDFDYEVVYEDITSKVICVISKKE